MAKSLTQALAKVIDSLADKPAPLPLITRGKLVKILPLAKSLEKGAAIRKAEKNIAILQTANEELKTENENLKIQLQEANVEIERLREEEKKREEKEPDEIDPRQFKILDLLPSPSGTHWLKSDEIARAMNIPLDEADAFIGGLEKRGFIIFHYHEPGGGGWRRTEEGNRLAVAKRWAGEQDDKERCQYPDLPKIQHDLLMLIAAGQDHGGNEFQMAEKLSQTLGVIRLNLKALRKADMASDVDEEADYGAGRTFYLKDRGAEYLNERGLPF